MIVSDRAREEGRGEILRDPRCPSPSRGRIAAGAEKLRAGDWVEVKTAPEILGTLDEQGRLDALPFMPEMVKYCGRRFQVFKRADKTCDTILASGLRRMHKAVHLAELRCDGQMHDGCQAGCLLFWKEAWLNRVHDQGQSAPVEDIAAENWSLTATVHAAGEVRCSLQDLMKGTRSVNDSGTVYTCQATELRAATSPLPWWRVDQYVRDIQCGNATIAQIFRGGCIGFFNRAQGALGRILPTRFLFRGGLKYPFIQGVLTKTPTAALHLQPGEIVEIKSKKEIVATLDRSNRNRGLLFDREELQYCGRRARVLRRVNRFIDEKTRTMVHLDSDSIILDGVYCRGDFNRCCPRSIYPFWREIWLRRVDESSAAPLQPQPPLSSEPHRAPPICEFDHSTCDSE